jgi:phytoene dehydrogenase-like protein
MIKKKVDVLVVGSGIGGLTSGLFLSKRGFETLICEKNIFMEVLQLGHKE